MGLFSKSKKGIIGDYDYLKTIKKLEKYAIDRNDDSILVRELTL